MTNFISATDAHDIAALAEKALQLRAHPFAHASLGRNKMLGLIFLNPSLRTRLSTQKAAANLGLNVMTMNIDKEGWALEFTDGAVMNGTTVEHIKDAAAVLGSYCDIIGIRCFASLQDRKADYEEALLNSLIRHSRVPVVNLESATLHPLQSLADLMTIRDNWQETRRPKVVLTWAPHVKALPQAVANSFAQWMNKAEVSLTIAHPEGMALRTEYSGNANIVYHQEEALADADFIYVKNWSAYEAYGKVLTGHDDWMLTERKLTIAPNAKIMHCLPVRRNVELSDELLDGSRSLVQQQAANRVFAAQAVLKEILETI